MFHRPKAEEPKSVSGGMFQQNEQGAQDKAEDKEINQDSNVKDTTMSSEDNKNEENTERSVDIPTGASPFSKSSPAPMGGRMPSYPGAPSPSTPSYASGLPGHASGRRLTVGPGITMSGEIESCDHLVVEGTVEAALKGASVLEITEAGVFYGTVEIDEATIAGRFEGDLTVHGRLTIKDTGSITGAISYKELAVEAGAVVDGKISPLKKSATNEKKAPAAVSAPIAPPVARNVKQEQEMQEETAKEETKKSDGGLFGSRVMDAVG